MPWRTKFNHQNNSFTHKVQGFPSAVNDSYIYIYIYAYTFMQNSFLKILTHLVLSVTSQDFFPLWSDMLGNEWDRRKWQYLYRHLYKVIQILSIPRIKAH